MFIQNNKPTSLSGELTAKLLYLARFWNIFYLQHCFSHKQRALISYENCENGEVCAVQAPGL